MSDPLVERLVVNDIPVYRFYKNSREAVDKYLTLIAPDMQVHIDADKADKPLFYVIDISRSGMFSVNYATQRVQKLASERPNVSVSYIAYISEHSNDAILLNLINALTARQLEHTRKIFSADQFDEAIAWLSGIREKETSE